MFFYKRIFFIGAAALILTLKPALADWTVDLTIPSCSIGFSPTIPQPTGTLVTVTVSASGGTNPSVTSLSLNSTDDVTGSLTGSNPKTYIWTSNNTVPAFSASARNSAGNIGSCSTSTVSCSVSPTSIDVGGSATWTATNIPGAAYTWSGTNLSGSVNSNTVRYDTAGTKNGYITVVSGGQTFGPVACTNSLTVNAAASAWIQTTGDVHSNSDINITGGP